MNASDGQSTGNNAAEDSKISPPQDQNTLGASQNSAAKLPETEAKMSDGTDFDRDGESLYLGDLRNLSKTHRLLEVIRCLDSVSGGSGRPWKAYPGHSKLIALDMDLKGIRESPQYHLALLFNSEIEDWLDWWIQPDVQNTKRGRQSTNASLKLLLITLTGGESLSATADDDSNVLRKVFSEWSFPTAALSILLDRRVTCIDRQVAISSRKAGVKKSHEDATKVYCIGMRQWSMVWSSNSSGRFQSRGVIMCLDRTWASSVPGVVLQYFKTLWMFLEYKGIFPLVGCMTSLRYAASALVQDDKEVFQREYELRSWLKGGLATEKKDLGYTSAQVSWLSSRVSSHRDCLIVIDRMLGIMRETLETYKVHARKDDIEILRNCISNLADMNKHLRTQAQRLEDQANVQLAAFFNLITQKDSATAMVIAKTSQSIAADSRRDQKVSVDIANSSRAIAFNTLRDSASMKAIANVTMVFLPGTFIASVFSMPFFGSQKGVRFFVSAKIWIYVAITIPLTIATLAYIWYHFSARSHRPLQDVDAEESRLDIVGGVMNGGDIWMNMTQGQNINLSVTETNAGLGACAQNEERWDGTSKVDSDPEQQELNGHNFEHWDPITREFAPSVFTASSFAFTEVSRSAKSLNCDVASTQSPQRPTKGPAAFESKPPDEDKENALAPDVSADFSVQDQTATDKVLSSTVEGRRLYIGNLAYAATDGELNTFFAGYDM
jgi:hypothetical protein